MKPFFKTAMLLLMSLLISTSKRAIGQDSASELVTTGLRQLEEARAKRSDQAYQEAENTLAKALAKDPDNPEVLIHLGEVEMARSGLLAQQGNFGAAGEMIQAAMANMDRAILLAPEKLDLRLSRGLAYGAFPPWYNKAAIAREDIEAAVRHPQFQGLPKDQRAHALLVLGIAYTTLSEVSKALESFHAAIDADQTSRFGKDAGDRIQALIGAGVTDGTPYHPDRFPHISSDTSPLMAAASITFPNADRSETQARIEYMSKELDGFPGLLGKNLVASVDHPGMFTIFTWWKNKQTLNEFYYSDLHQSWMGMRGQTITRGNWSPEEVPSQMAIEVFVGLPGGIQVNGGFVPRELFETLQPPKTSRDPGRPLEHQ